MRKEQALALIQPWVGVGADSSDMGGQETANHGRLLGRGKKTEARMDQRGSEHERHGWLAVAVEVEHAWRKTSCV